jgi:hypothetical protein
MSTATTRPSLASPIVNLTRNLDALRDFVTLIRAFLENELKVFSESRETDLIPLRFAIAEVDHSAHTTISADEAARLRSKFGNAFSVTNLGDRK